MPENYTIEATGSVADISLTCQDRRFSTASWALVSVRLWRALFSKELLQQLQLFLPMALKNFAVRGFQHGFELVKLLVKGSVASAELRLQSLERSAIDLLSPDKPNAVLGFPTGKSSHRACHPYLAQTFDHAL